MTDSKPNKTLEQLQGEYQNLCARAGDIQYRISTLKEELSSLNSAIREVNLEAAKAHAEKKAAAEETAKTVEKLLKL